MKCTFSVFSSLHSFCCLPASPLLKEKGEKQASLNPQKMGFFTAFNQTLKLIFRFNSSGVKQPLPTYSSRPELPQLSEKSCFFCSVRGMALSFPILSLFRESFPNREEGFRKDWTVTDIKCDADQQFTCNTAKHGLFSKSQILLF